MRRDMAKPNAINTFGSVIKWILSVAGNGLNYVAIIFMLLIKRFLWTGS